MILFALLVAHRVNSNYCLSMRCHRQEVSIVFEKIILYNEVQSWLR